MATLPTFDIFSGIPDRDALWVCAVQGLADAKERMDKIAAEKPGPYFVFLSTTHEILARIDTPAKPHPQRVYLRHPQLEAAMSILRRIGFTVGEVTDLDGQPFVAIDSELREVEEAFALVEAYNRRRA